MVEVVRAAKIIPNASGPPDVAGYLRQNLCLERGNIEARLGGSRQLDPVTVNKCAYRRDVWSRPPFGPRSDYMYMPVFVRSSCLSVQSHITAFFVAL